MRAYHVKNYAKVLEESLMSLESKVFGYSDVLIDRKIQNLQTIIRNYLETLEA